MDAYFQSFPSITYGALSAINIMERTAILNSIFSTVYTFYPYTVKDGMRARTIAERYYGDPNLEWLVYFSNNIIDPYYDWPMDENTFNEYIIQNYGSIEEAQNKIISYRVNWYADDRVLSQSQFDTLQPYERKYWTPVYDSFNKPATYVRKQIDYQAVAQDGNGNITLSIPSEESSYWDAVTAWDHETEENIKKSYIQLLDSKLLTTAVDNLKTLMSE
jgi:hypothetical protein